MEATPTWAGPDHEVQEDDLLQTPDTAIPNVTKKGKHSDHHKKNTQVEQHAHRLPGNNWARGPHQLKLLYHAGLHLQKVFELLCTLQKEIAHWPSLCCHACPDNRFFSSRKRLTQLVPTCSHVVTQKAKVTFLFMTPCPRCSLFPTPSLQDRSHPACPCTQTFVLLEPTKGRSSQGNHALLTCHETSGKSMTVQNKA